MEKKEKFRVEQRSAEHWILAFVACIDTKHTFISYLFLRFFFECRLLCFMHVCAFDLVFEARELWQ